MLPPGLGFNAVSKKVGGSQDGKAAALLLGLGDVRHCPHRVLSLYPGDEPALRAAESLKMVLDEEGLPAVFHRHARHAERSGAVVGRGLEVLCTDPREHSNSLTAVLVPSGFDADRLREIILEAFDMSLGTGLGRLRGKVFRIGHLGHFNDLMLSGTLAGVEMGLHRAGIPHRPGGVTAALEFLGSVQSELVSPA
jgi:alanine-glyoxylate transaminase/serine-glyoxylate transaminase/serine-pyruvate transaminase